MSGPWLAATNSRHPWLRTLQYGLLWAAATTGMESVLLPVRDMPTDVMLWFLLGIGMQWGVVGVLAANVAVVAERRLTPWTLVALALLSPFVLASFSSSSWLARRARARKVMQSCFQEALTWERSMSMPRG